VESKGVADKQGSTYHRVLVRTATGDERAYLTVASSSTKAIKTALGEKLIAMNILKDDTKKQRITAVATSPALEKTLVEFEAKHVIAKTNKFGVLYCKRGNRTETQMLENRKQDISPEFEESLNFLGRRVDLKTWSGFKGGLFVGDELLDGDYSIFTEFGGIQIMFHVSALLRHEEGDSQHTVKKRHIGNDIGVIVFRDHDCEFGDASFNPLVVRSQFNHAFAIIQPTKPLSNSSETPTKYRMAYAAKETANPPHQPLLPFPAIFEKDKTFRTLLISKLGSRHLQ